MASWFGVDLEPADAGNDSGTSTSIHASNGKRQCYVGRFLVALELIPSCKRRFPQQDISFGRYIRRLKTEENMDAPCVGWLQSH